jgi:glucose/mannose-6-phosphate isomerase
MQLRLKNRNDSYTFLWKRTTMSNQNILDDMDYVRKTDKSDMLSSCVSAAENYAKALKQTKRMSLPSMKPRDIIIAGMGGSAISGELLIDWTRDQLSIPMAICREYALPAYAGKDTLVIVNSYSGDTEESLSSLIDALDRKCMVICIGSGGRLLEAAQRLDLPHVRVPSGMPPRAALPFMFTPLIVIVEKLGLVHSVDDEFLEVTKVLNQISEAGSPGQPYEKNFPKQLASQILHTIPIIYGFGMYRGAAQRLKQQFNENGKTPAKWDYFSELNHNETVGWESSDEFLKCLSTIFIRDKHEPIEIRSRIEITKKLLPRQLKAFEIWSRGDSTLSRLLSAILIGDFASVYLAILRGIDPTPVKTVSELKRNLEKSETRAKILQRLAKITRK